MVVQLLLGVFGRGALEEPGGMNSRGEIPTAAEREKREE